MAHWTRALALATLLLAAQQVAWLHPLWHLGGAASGHARMHDDTNASDAAELACSLCLACAAATQLATAAPLALLALARSVPLEARTLLARPVARPPSSAHNRGPPGRA